MRRVSRAVFFGSVDGTGASLMHAAHSRTMRVSSRFSYAMRGGSPDSFRRIDVVY